jgi:Tol biopolymer transport system component
VIKVGSLDGKTDRILFHASSSIAYDTGYLLFMINDKLMARRFDPEKMEFSGDPFAVAEDVQFDPAISNGVFSASGTGALLYEAGNASNQRKIEMLDARGSLVGNLSDQGRIFDLRISPDGKRVAYVLADETTGKRNIWVYEIATGNRIRIRDPRSSRGPLWSHDGTRIAFTSGFLTGKPVTYYMPANGMGEEQELWVPQGSSPGWRGDWTPDSNALVLDEPTEAGKNRISMALIGGKGKTVPLLETAGANVGGSRLSADGRWIAYMSDESASLSRLHPLAVRG